jgi:hypothetical protein
MRGDYKFTKSLILNRKSIENNLFKIK